MVEKDGCRVNSSHFHVQGGGLDGKVCFPIDYMLQKAIAAEQAKACKKVELGENEALSRVKKCFFFPENLNVARGGAEGNIERFVYKFMKINLASGQHSRVTVHCYPMTSSQIFQCCPQRFWWKRFHWQMSCDVTSK